jgi:hypothetical protein
MVQSGQCGRGRLRRARPAEDRKDKATFSPRRGHRLPLARLRLPPRPARGDGGVPSTSPRPAARRAAALRCLDMPFRMGYGSASRVSAARASGRPGWEGRGEPTVRAPRCENTRSCQLSQEEASSGKILMKDRVFARSCKVCYLPPRHSFRESCRVQLSRDEAEHHRRS